MENFRSQIDLFLTEISIELLGNKIYNINGKRQDKLINLFKATPENHRESAQSNENKNDFLCSLGYQSDFSSNDTKEFLEDQLNFILEDSNKTSKVNQDVIETLRSYKTNQANLVADVSELNIKKIVEKQYNIIVRLGKARGQVISEDFKGSDSEKDAAVKKYYARERNDLIKMCMDTLRLMKYILNDPRNEESKGNLIGFVHAIRSVKDDSSKSFRGLRAKPYRRPTKDQNSRDSS